MVQTSATATNKGGWRGSFQIQVTGSNGYSKSTGPVAPTGYSLETLPNAVKAPTTDKTNQARFIQPVTLDYYSLDLCAAARDKQTAYFKSQAKHDCNYKNLRLRQPLHPEQEWQALDQRLCVVYTVH
jgi:hypothetical protein